MCKMDGTIQTLVISEILVRTSGAVQNKLTPTRRLWYKSSTC